MTLLEAISPTARELLRVDPTCACRTEKNRVHAVHHEGRPLCGGGPGARNVKSWQTDLGPVNCARCLAIQRKHP